MLVAFLEMALYELYQEDDINIQYGCVSENAIVKNAIVIYNFTMAFLTIF